MIILESGLPLLQLALVSGLNFISARLAPESQLEDLSFGRGKHQSTIGRS